MDEKKKELKTNLISSFLILLSCCMTLALLINLRFHQDCATVIVGMLGVCATLYAPIAAFFFYDSWKEPKQYELEKQYAESVLQLLNLINKELTSSYYRMCIKERLDTELVVLNSLKKEKNIEIEDYLYKAYAEFKTLSLIKSGSKFIDNFKEIETQILVFNGTINHMENSYIKNYYRNIPEKYKEGYSDIFKNREPEDAISNAGIMLFKRSLESKILVEVQEYHKGCFIPHKFTYEEHKNNYERSYENIVEILVDIIKLKKIPAS